MIIKYFVKCVVFCLFMAIVYIFLIINFFTFIDKKELNLIKSIASKVLLLNIKDTTNIYKYYWNDINITLSETKLLDNKGLGLRYEKNMYFFILSKGLDDYYYYNLTKDCWYDNIIDDKYFLFLDNCTKEYKYQGSYPISPPNPTKKKGTP